MIPVIVTSLVAVPETSAIPALNASCCVSPNESIESPLTVTEALITPAERTALCGGGGDRGDGGLYRCGKRHRS